MQNFIRILATRLLIASSLLSPVTLSSSIVAQDRQRRTTDETSPQKTWPTAQPSIVKKASESKEPVQVSNEPVMRIALSTDSRIATVSTTAQLLNASEIASEALPLNTSRLRIDSRMLSPSQAGKSRAFDLEFAQSCSHDKAGRMI